MLENKQKEQIIDGFTKSFRTWIESYSNINYQHIIDKDWAEEVKDKYTPGQIAIACYPKWESLHKAENDNAKKLMKQCKSLLALLVTQNMLGTQQLKELEILIEAKNNGAHLRYIK